MASKNWWVFVLAACCLAASCGNSKPVGDATDLTTTQEKKSTVEVSEPLPKPEPRSVEELLAISGDPLSVCRELQVTIGSRFDCSGVDLSGTYLNKTDLSGVDLTGANFTGANLRWADLTGAWHEETTIWPMGFIPPSM